MDLEPGRCRRTDGKKWRCRLAVLPDQKYCERHIHRGCLRSRKPVEDHMSKSTAKITVSPLKSTINLTKSDARKDKSVCIKNRNNSFKIKKRSREDDARVPLEFSFSPKSVLQNDNGMYVLKLFTLLLLWIVKNHKWLKCPYDDKGDKCRE